MGEESPSTERKRNIWAPWRIEYIDGLHDRKDDGCFLCRYREDRQNDRKNLVLWRGRRSLAVLNRFPYTGGHSLVAPLEHLAGMDDLEPGTMLEMMEIVRDLRRVLAHAIHAEGFNVGMNIGRCAGAGLPDHLHIHVVPRWAGDTNFMPVLAEAHVMPQTLEDLYDRLAQAGGQLHLPDLSS
jgi:ATP adenylyltransferase